MKVTRVKAFPINLSFRSDYPANSFGRPSSHDTIVVLLETDTGQVGIGEAPPELPLVAGGTRSHLLDVINNYYGHAIVGKDPRQLNLIHESMDRTIWGDANLEIARAALDCALHDVLGKELGVQAVDLIGGKVRDRMSAMGGIGIDAPEAMAAEAKKYTSSYPVQIMKVKIGGGRIHSRWPSRLDPELDIRRLQAVREALGDRITIIADANQSYTASLAIQMLNKVRVENLMIEQPVDENDIDGLRRVAESVDIPVVVDESAYTSSRLLKVLKTVPIDFVNVKPSRAGGFYGTMKMVRVIESAGMKCTIDCIQESRIAGAMIAHIAAAVREDAYLGTTATLISDLWLNDQSYWTGGARFEKDHFVLLEKPGLGLDISNQVLDLAEKYQPTT